MGEWTEVASAKRGVRGGFRDEVEEEGQQPQSQPKRGQHPQRQEELLAQQRAHEDLAQRGLGVDLPRADRTYDVRAPPRRSGHPDPRGRLLAHVGLTSRGG